MKLHTHILTIFLPIITGLVIAIFVLYFKPGTGQHLGDIIYSKGLSDESYAYAVSKASSSVVNIYVARLNEDYSTPRPNTITASASGVVINDNGLVVTNYHVVTSGNAPSNAIFVQTADGKLFKAFVLGSDRRTDLALLKVDATNLKAIKFATKLPKVGDVVLAIGNPNNLGQTVTHGIVSALSRTGTGILNNNTMDVGIGIQELIQTDAPINEGNSGGALVNTKGQLIGINTAYINTENTYGIGFSIPVDMMKKIVYELIAHGKIERGYLGIACEDIAPFYDESKIQITYVDPEGPAFGLLKNGDIIVNVNNNALSNSKTLIDLVTGSKPDTKLSFDIIRNQKPLKIDVILKEDRG